MPRPCKRRRICAEPSCCRFGPKGGEPPRRTVTMTLDEYESIRLIDLDGLTQEQCAGQMAVARTTAQAIYNSARAKLADCLVNGSELFISGGEYVLCAGADDGCGCARRQRGGCRFEERITEGSNMKKIAVTYENGQVFQHFGHTEQFKLYTASDGRVVSSAVVGTNGSGHGALAGMLASLNVDTLVCGGIGGGARTALGEAGIKVFAGVSGGADEAVASLLAGRLDYDPDALCAHHGEHHGDCGEHEHKCE